MTHANARAWRKALGILSIASIVALLSGAAAFSFRMAAAGMPAVSAASGDSRPMTKTEQATFVALTCAAPTYDPKLGQYQCTKLVGYPHGPTDVADFGFSAIAYGAFTHLTAYEAYASYSTMSESHADNFGGGVLFERTGSSWKLGRWYPGGQLDRCIAVPGGGIARMLCLSGFMAEGEVTTAISVRTVPVSNDAKSIAAASRVVISTDDTRNESSLVRPPKGTACGAITDYKPSVVTVDTLKRYDAPSFFAESKATYVTAHDWYRACRTSGWANVKGVSITIRYALENGKVTVESPLTIKSQAS
jgi:hypothetical protein